MLFVIVKKELKRVFSDRRLVFSAFILPALSIYILYSLLGNMIGNMSNDIEEHVANVIVINAPDEFQKYMTDYESEQTSLKNEQGNDYAGFQLSVTYENALNDSFLDSVKEGDVDIILEFGNSFSDSVINYQSEKQPDLDLYYNPSEEFSQTAMSKVQYVVLEGFQNALLEDRFGDLSVLTAFTINNNDKNHAIAKEGKEAGLGLSFMLPMLLNIMLFAGAMGIGIDVIAGEKERGTMATMLLAPVDRETIAFGKVISLGIVASLSAMCTFGAIIASLPNASEFLAAGSDVSLNNISFGALDFLMLLVILIVQVGIFVAIICLVSVIAKSVKEAGTYISPIYMLVMISAFATVFTTGDVQLYKFVIPVLGNVFAIKELFTFDLSVTEFGVTVGVSIIVIGILLKLITMAFNNERTMFNS